MGVVASTLPLIFKSEKHLVLQNMNKLSHIHFFNTPFEADKCDKGFAPSWAGGCACFNEMGSGRYCKQLMSKKVCHTNQDCDKNSYCSLNFQTGICKPIEALKPVQTKKGTFILSAELLSKKSADNFCASLDSGYKSASRSDFNTNQTGIGKVDLEIFIPIKKAYTNRGFFWLESIEGEDNAYYADLNDGTIYHTNQNNKSTMQAMCIK